MRQTGLNRKKAEPETPADCVVRVFGIVRASAIAGVTSEAIKRWRRRGGLVPSRHQRKYLRQAQAEALPLTADMLIAEPRPAEPQS